MMRKKRVPKTVDDAAVEKTLTCMPSIMADMVRVQRLTGGRPQDQLQPPATDETLDRKAASFMSREELVDEIEKHGLK